MLTVVWQEIRYAARALRRSVLFSVTAIATLALGIGATTAIFTVLDRVVLRPLPYSSADRLVNIRSSVSGKTTAGFWGVSVAGYFEYRRHNHTFEDLGAYASWLPTIAAEDNSPERVPGALVTASVVHVLGLRALTGRLFTIDDDHPGAPSVVVLSEELWQRRFGRDPHIVGQSIVVEGTPHTVVGIMAAGMQLPDQAVAVWLPLPIDSLAPPVNDHSLNVIGKLKPDVTPAAAQRDLATLTTRFPELFPNAYSAEFIRDYHFTPVVTPTRDLVLGDIGRVLWILLGADALVLLIACANVANLHLVRLELRQREIAVRRALGASTRHLTWHFLSESLLLAAAAGALGIFLSWIGIRTLLSLAPASIPRLAEIHLDAATIVFAVLLTSGIAIVFGLAPHLRRSDLTALRESGRGATSSKGQLSTREVLLVAQVALAFVLLAGAALLVESFRNLRQVRPGFDPENALTFTVALPRASYHDFASVERFYRMLLERLSGLPDVTAAGATQSLPLADYGGAACALVFLQERPLASGEQPPCITKMLVAPTYFEAMRIPVRGQVSSWSDVENHVAGVVVSEAFARRFWPNENALGKAIGNSPRPPFYRIVGIAGDVRADGLDQPAPAIVYYPMVPLAGTFLWGSPSEMSVVLRTRSDDPLALAPYVRRTMADLDRSVPIANVAALRSLVSHSMARVAFATLLLGIAAAMALLLSAIGVFGAIAFMVSQRRREIGVRIALGAEPQKVSLRIVLQAVRFGAIGLAIGLVIAIATTRLMRSLLVGVRPADPLSLVLAAIVVLGAVAVSSYLPARRAAHVSPVDALRAE
jgi:predicted permease